MTGIETALLVAGTAMAAVGLAFLLVLRRGRRVAGAAACP